MFDIGASELLLVAIVAILVIGPKDLPKALRTLGQWIARGRKVSRHFRSGLDAMIREAELEDFEKEWAERNAQIMKQHGTAMPMTARSPLASEAAEHTVIEGEIAEDERAPVPELPASPAPAPDAQPDAVTSKGRA